MLQLEEEEETKNGKVIVDYKPDVDYKSEGPESNDEPVVQEEEKETLMKSIQNGASSPRNSQTKDDASSVTGLNLAHGFSIST